MAVWFFTICRKFQFNSMNVSKVVARRKLKKISLTAKFQHLWNFQPHYFEKLNFFPSKNHLDFLTIERYDIQLSNIKFQIKILCLGGGAQVPEGGSSLLLYLNFADFGAKCWVTKNFQAQNFIVYGNYQSLTREVGFQVIS